MTNHLFVTWQDFHVRTKQLSEKLLESGQKWNKIIAVTRGGMIPATIVARDLGIRHIETICAESYEFDQQSDKVKILHAPSNIGTGKGCLFIDDLSDLGNTFRKIKTQFTEATLACVYAKPKGMDVPDFYVEETSADTWIHLPWEEQDFTEEAKKVLGGHLGPYLK